MTVEIRCCCNPAQLLGWVELAGRDEIREGEAISFALRELYPPERLSDAEADYWAFGRIAPPEILRLDVAFWSHVVAQSDGSRHMESGLALKSADTPIETLRRIRSFRENIL
jgi:hypothetical protein